MARVSLPGRPTIAFCFLTRSDVQRPDLWAEWFRDAPEPGMFTVFVHRSDAQPGNALEGVGATLKIFLKVLGEHGVAQFGAPGERFNPNVHEAVAMVPAAPGQEANSVVAVLKVGYMFKDRVLRPAQVTVAMKAAAMEEAQAAVDATAGSSRSL